MSTRATRRTQKTGEVAKIDLSTLLPGAGKKGRKPEGDKIYTHTWTRAQGEGAGKKEEFRVVGIVPKKREGKGRLKQLGRWRISKAEDKWKENDSIVFIPTVYLSTFTKYFPKYYTDKEEILENENPNDPEFLDVWIAGPRDAVIENLQQEDVLPNIEGLADTDAADKWLNEVAITADNYTGEMADIYQELKDHDTKMTEEKQKEEANPQKIHELIELAKAIRGKKVDVHVLDVNDISVGKYGTVPSKPIRNVFTDALISNIKKGKIKEGVVPNQFIDISTLTTDPSSRVSSMKPISESINPSKGEYGTTSKRSLGLNLTFTYDGKEYPLGDHFVWTTKAAAVNVLFKEMEAVNGKSSKTGMHYDYGNVKADTVKITVNELLREYQREHKEKVTKPGVRKGVDKINK
jgi:hypothetical protein